MELKIVVVMSAIFILLIAMIIHTEMTESDMHKKCNKAGGTLLSEYKSRLYICAKVEKIIIE